MRSATVDFFETLFYRPRWYHWLVAMGLLPLSILYGTGMWIRRRWTGRHFYPAPIISIGNLSVGGSGKTPFVIMLARYFAEKKVAIVSRGYGRQSRGLVEVSRNGTLLTNVLQSGDEAMLLALRAPYSSVIVSEQRNPAIEKALRQGAELVLLDDGFGRVEIEKFEILLEPGTLPNRLTLPAGPLREFVWSRAEADLVLREGKDFSRGVRYQNLKKRMLLLTAIANPSRLNPYLPDGVVAKIYLENHAYFDAVLLQEYLNMHGAESLLVTEKDWVKLKDFDLPLSLMVLELELNEGIMPQIETYIRTCK